MSTKKSARRSNTSILWYKCEKCLVNITSKDRDCHEKVCPIIDETAGLTYISNNILYVHNIEVRKPPDEETKDIAKKYLNSLIYLSENTMKLCEFYIGQLVQITTYDNKVIIRLCWPLPENSSSTVFVSQTDFEDNWIKYKNKRLKIEKLCKDVELGDQIVLTVDENIDIDRNAVKDITRILKNQMKNLVYCLDNRIMLDFYNSKFSFTVTSFTIKMLDDSESLVAQMENLKLKPFENFVLVTDNTKIKIIGKQFETTEKKTSVKKTVKTDVGGLDEVFATIEGNIDIALGFSKIVSNKLRVSRGILLHGPTGCGKTMVCEVIKNYYEDRVKIIKINTGEIYSKFFGETEQKLRTYFDSAFDANPRPAIIVIEDIDSICPKNETNQLSQRLSVALFNLIDDIHIRVDENRVFVLATCGSLENLNPSIRRFGRLDTEIEVSVPNPNARKEILKKQLSGIDNSLTNDDITTIANNTHGFVGSDLVNLIYKAAVHSMDRKAPITSTDLDYALLHVKPSAMREIQIECPNVKWSDIGGQEDLKLKLKQAIEWPLMYTEKFKKLGIKPPRGVLMFGPPGCSKTMIAKALATECKVNFLSIRGPELFSMWVGESERAVRDIFRKARQVAPAIIFFDEIDAIGGERSSSGSSSSVKERVLTQLLTELDGVDTLKDVTIVAATNRPDMCDAALLRPGRIDRIIYVGLPDEKTREAIFNIKLKSMPISANLQKSELIRRTEGYSGAEISAVCNEAALKALEENLNTEEVHMEHFEHALKIIMPRTSKNLMDIYEEYMNKK